ncbi:HlyD family efflux transporter periplasmic adaptor subunit [Rhodobacteraceae bacterium HSP-20]|uniref:HlyD family efflux transporter periplasmic adaptor subunit n=1 Tax=Paragemmobacter amnigenus TaxID=2852097 RepID=A0ABS6J344_9RHOB|nr:HlyD family efflux transporter periplasmic adaptor subunit [Rhodobacter amnigenus]MBU9697942.1 HlyD family efflux transporter periplasmic adaptor subunit [Rhodobacter amnigenus]MBV4389169.1 HlyD family efflux transporter periplasmic adaptor subunit [Rhodobacter amnigenus]
MTATFDPPLDRRDRRPSATVWLIGMTVLAFLLWSAFAWVEEIVRAPGQIVPSSRPQIIQNLEGGILAELSVSEGDTVEAGQVLARLHATQYQAAVDDLTDQIATLDARRLRLEAELAGQDSFVAPPDLVARVPDIVASELSLLSARRTDLASRIAGARAVLEQAAQEEDMVRRMADRGLAPEIELTRAEKALADARARLDEVTTGAELERADDYARTQGELASLRQKLKLSQDQLSRTTLTAPLRGVVNRIAVTTIGGVVRPGEEILQIIPLDTGLFVEAKVRPADIAALREGQSATVKLSAYDYTIWGTLPATVTFVSADTFRDERSRDAEPHYRVTLRVDQDSLTERQKSIAIRPGMQAEVEFQTGGKTILTYLTKPLWRGSEALRER